MNGINAVFCFLTAAVLYKIVFRKRKIELIELSRDMVCILSGVFINLVCDNFGVSVFSLLGFSLFILFCIVLTLVNKLICNEGE